MGSIVVNRATVRYYNADRKAGCSPATGTGSRINVLDRDYSDVFENGERRRRVGFVHAPRRRSLDVSKRISIS